MKNIKSRYCGFLYFMLIPRLSTQTLIVEKELQKETLFCSGPVIFCTFLTAVVVEDLVFETYSEQFGECYSCIRLENLDETGAR